MGHLAGGTVDPAVRGEGVGPVQGDQDSSVQDPVIRQASLGPKSVSDLLDQRGHLLRLDRIQDVPDLDVRRDILHAEKGLDIVPAGRQSRSPLESQKGGRLSEERGKSPACRVAHRVYRIVPGLAAIRKGSESGGHPCRQNARKHRVCSVFFYRRLKLLL